MDTTDTCAPTRESCLHRTRGPVAWGLAHKAPARVPPLWVSLCQVRPHTRQGCHESQNTTAHGGPLARVAARTNRSLKAAHVPPSGSGPAPTCPSSVFRAEEGQLRLGTLGALPALFSHVTTEGAQRLFQVPGRGDIVLVPFTIQLGRGARKGSVMEQLGSCALCLLIQAWGQCSCSPRKLSASCYPVEKRWHLLQVG